MTESEEVQINSGYTQGTVYFTKDILLENNIAQPRILISYSKPEIQGKGGACESGYTKKQLPNKKFRLVFIKVNSQ